MKLLLILTVLVLLFCFATNRIKKTSTSNIHGKLMIALGELPTNKMQCVAEFMKDPDDFKKIALDKNAKVLLDEKELKFDDSYYPSYVDERNAKEFLGKHKWTIDLGNNKKKEFEINVVPFKITTAIPANIGRSDLKISCENLKNSDNVFLMLSGDFSDKSETTLEIKAQDGFFVIPKDFIKKVDPIKIEMNFNITRANTISNDDFFNKGIVIEWTKITKKYVTKVVR